MLPAGFELLRRAERSVGPAGKKKAAASSDDAETGFVRQVVNLHDKYLEVRTDGMLLLSGGIVPVRLVSAHTDALVLTHKTPACMCIMCAKLSNACEPSFGTCMYKH